MPPSRTESKPKNPAYIYFLPAEICALLIWIALTLPTDFIEQTSHRHWLLEFVLSDVFLHWFMFAVLTWLLCWGSAASQPPRISYRLVFLISFGYGVLLELWQICLPYRSFSIRDIFMDLTGTVSSVLLFRLLPHAGRFPKKIFQKKQSNGD